MHLVVGVDVYSLLRSTSQLVASVVPSTVLYCIASKFVVPYGIKWEMSFVQVWREKGKVHRYPAFIMGCDSGVAP